MDTNSLASAYSRRSNPSRIRANQMLQMGANMQATEPAGIAAKAMMMGLAGLEQGQADQYDREREAALMEKERRTEDRENRLMDMKEQEFAANSVSRYVNSLDAIKKLKAGPQFKQALAEKLTRTMWEKSGIDNNNIDIAGMDLSKPEMTNFALRDTRDGTMVYTAIGSDGVPYEYDAKSNSMQVMSPETMARFGKANNFHDTDLGDKIERKHADGTVEYLKKGMAPGTAASLAQSERHFKITRDDRLAAQEAKEDKSDLAKNPYFNKALDIINNDPKNMGLSPSEKIDMAAQEAIKIESSLRGGRKTPQQTLQNAYVPGGPVSNLMPRNSAPAPAATGYTRDQALAEAKRRGLIR